MENLVILRHQFEEALSEGEAFMRSCTEDEWTLKASPVKWSKKEILGHLTDSASYNLQRFIEIQFKPKPFKIYSYAQDDLVRVNDYQHADTEELVTLWRAINCRIVSVFGQLSPETLAFSIQFENGQLADLSYLMEDYVRHLKHHLSQIMKT